MWWGGRACLEICLQDSFCEGGNRRTGSGACLQFSSFSRWEKLRRQGASPWPPRGRPMAAGCPRRAPARSGPQTGQGWWDSPRCALWPWLPDCPCLWAVPCLYDTVRNAAAAELLWARGPGGQARLDAPSPCPPGLAHCSPVRGQHHGTALQNLLRYRSPQEPLGAGVHPRAGLILVKGNPVMDGGPANRSPHSSSGQLSAPPGSVPTRAHLQASWAPRGGLVSEPTVSKLHP